MRLPIHWKSKLKASVIHLALSMVLATLAAGLVFYVWYPAPYRELLWGQDIYLWLIVVDTVLGPLLTFVVFNQRKRLLERLVDFSLVGALQIGALIFGVWALAQARPVYVVFEYDKFQVVPVYLVPEYALKQAPSQLQNLPWGRPGILSLRRLPEDEEDIAVWVKNMDFGGPPLAVQPKLWQNYGLAAEQVAKVSTPFGSLSEKYAEHKQELHDILSRSTMEPDQLIGVPIFSGDGSGVLILSKETKAVVDLLVLKREIRGW